MVYDGRRRSILNPLLERIGSHAATGRARPCRLLFGDFLRYPIRAMVNSTGECWYHCYVFFFKQIESDESELRPTHHITGRLPCFTRAVLVGEGRIGTADIDR